MLYTIDSTIWKWILDNLPKDEKEARWKRDVLLENDAPNYICETYKQQDTKDNLKWKRGNWLFLEPTWGKRPRIV